MAEAVNTVEEKNQGNSYENEPIPMPPPADNQPQKPVAEEPASTKKTSIKGLLTIPSANTYEDSGLHTFEPYQVLPVQVQSSSAYSRCRRVSPAKTVYMVYYRATDGSGYQWSGRAITRELGQETVKAGVPITRRVLSASGGRARITVEPRQTASHPVTQMESG